MEDEKIELAETALQYLRRLERGIAREIRNGRPKNSFDGDNMNDILEGMQYIMKVVVIITGDESLYSDTPSVLSSLLESVENRDNTTVLDILEYEFLPSLEKSKIILFNYLKEKED